MTYRTILEVLDMLMEEAKRDKVALYKIIQVKDKEKYI